MGGKESMAEAGGSVWKGRGEGLVCKEGEGGVRGNEGVGIFTTGLV